MDQIYYIVGWAAVFLGLWIYCMYSTMKGLRDYKKGAIKMSKELKPLTLNAKKWREENGYTTPEWEMYAKNCVHITMIFCLIFFVLGVIAERIL